MCKYKIGDEVLFLKKDRSHEEHLRVGSSYSIVRLWDPHYGLINDVGTTTFVDETQIILVSEVYQKSNRHKIHQAIKSTGLRADDLSLSAGFSKGYFSDYASKSRFNKRGDISESRLNELLTSLAFAERELLGVGAKTVDDANTDGNEIIEKLRAEAPEGATHYIGNSDQEGFDYYKSHQKPESKIVKYGLSIIAILVLLFINLGK